MRPGRPQKARKQVSPIISGVIVVVVLAAAIYFGLQFIKPKPNTITSKAISKEQIDESKAGLDQRTEEFYKLHPEMKTELSPKAKAKRAEIGKK
jgi:hypothetical protein